MDLQEEAGLERELEAKQEFCKQLQSLFMALPGPWLFLHLLSPSWLLQDPALHTDRNQGAWALEHSMAQHQELFLQVPPLVPRQQHFPQGYRNSPCSNRVPAPHWAALQESSAAQGLAWIGIMSPLHTPKE